MPVALCRLDQSLTAGMARFALPVASPERGRGPRGVPNMAREWRMRRQPSRRTATAGLGQNLTWRHDREYVRFPLKKQTLSVPADFICFVPLPDVSFVLSQSILRVRYCRHVWGDWSSPRGHGPLALLEGVLCAPDPSNCGTRLLMSPRYQATIKRAFPKQF